MHVHAPQAGKGAGRTTLVLRISMVATLAYVVLTFVAGLRAYSLALLSESGHNVSDFLALLLSFTAVHFQSRPADHSRTFGVPARRRDCSVHQRGHSYRHFAVDRC